MYSFSILSGTLMLQKLYKYGLQIYPTFKFLDAYFIKFNIFFSLSLICEWGNRYIRISLHPVLKGRERSSDSNADLDDGKVKVTFTYIDTLLTLFSLSCWIGWHHGIDFVCLRNWNNLEIEMSEALTFSTEASKHLLLSIDSSLSAQTHADGDILFLFHDATGDRSPITFLAYNTVFQQIASCHICYFFNIRFKF